MKFLIPLIIFCFSTLITPGPNNLMIMLSGVKFGIKPSLPHYFGIMFGFAFMVFLVGIGLGEVFTRLPILHEIIKYIGAVYMLYLAGKTILSDPHLANVKGKSQPLTFMQAVLFQWVNPKAWVMSIGAIATYTSMSGNVFGQVVVIAIMYLVIGIPCIGTWLVGGAALSRYLHNPKHMRIFNYVMGGLLAFSIILMFFE